jgi:hypothetical protein
MYKFVRVVARGAEQVFDDVKSAFEGIGPADKVFVVWNGHRFPVLWP